MFSVVNPIRRMSRFGTYAIGGASMSGRVAVIAVHGVADQLPFATARATADLLKCQLADEVPEFGEEQLRLEVHPLRAAGEAPPQQAPDAQGQTPETREHVQKQPADSGNSSRELALAITWKSGVKLSCDSREATLKYFDSKRSGDDRRQPDDATLSPDEADRKIILGASREASLEYFEKQLAEYHQQPADAMYETVCLSAKIGDKEVDVHEMYWADLSRVQSGIFHAIEELYYVLFAVCNIGRMELDRSGRLFKGWLWWSLRRCEEVAERILTLVVPLTNACLLLLMVFTLPQFLGNRIQVESWVLVLVPLGLGAGCVLGTVVFMWRSRPRPANARWFLLWGAVLGGLAGGGISGLPAPCRQAVLFGLLWSAAAAVLIGLSGKYNKRQPGALRVSVVLWLLVLVAVVGESRHRYGQPTFSALDVGLAAAEWTLVGLTLIWFAYLIATFACSVLGWFAVCGERKSPARHATAKRVVWTANLAILAPGMLCIVLNLGIWEAAYIAGGTWKDSLFPKCLKHTPICLHKDFLCVAGSLNQLADIDDRVSQQTDPCPAPEETTPLATSPEPGLRISVNRIPGLLLHNSALPMIVVLVALAFMLLTAAWLLLPAVLSEGATDGDRQLEYARQLGNSLSGAWKGLRIGAELFVRGQVFLLIAVCGCLLTYSPPAPPGSHFDLKYWLYVLSGPALGAMGALFVAFATGAIQYTGLRTIVDVAADVANWLRLHPRDDNPTSRISARYVSLLKHVAQKKDDAGHPYYERVVIFAHSLGSAITVDLLQFLKEDLPKHPEDQRLDRLHDDSLPTTDKLPVYLFTHGCPLRQLLGLRLPLTYGWAWHGSNGWDANNEPEGQELLGVVKWVNAYCSGDYVGRHLWHDDVDDIPWDSTRHEKSGTVPRVELCVGAGAHTHYWDPLPRADGREATASSAPSTIIADELRRLIMCELPT